MQAYIRETWGWAILIALMISGWSGTASAQAEAAYEELVKANKFASRGSISRSIQHYEKVLELAPEAYPLAYFNLAEVYRAKGDCHRAVILYSLFALNTEDASEIKETEKAKKQCGRTLIPLSVEVVPEGVTMIDGYLWTSTGKSTLSLLPGSYKIEASAIDHDPDTKTVELAKEPVSWTATLKKLQFFGTLIVGEVQVAGAKVRIFAGTSDKTELLYEGQLPMKEAIKLTEGKHFVEILAADHDRWIRNVAVGRDDKAEVKVNLSRSKPSELR